MNLELLKPMPGKTDTDKQSDMIDLNATFAWVLFSGHFFFLHLYI